MSFISPKHASDRSSGKRSRVLLDAHAAAIFGSLARLPERGGAYGWKRRAVEWCIMDGGDHINDDDYGDCDHDNHG